jgi:membrane protein YdbS with pleckstrin-like domain
MKKPTTQSVLDTLGVIAYVGILIALISQQWSSGMDHIVIASGVVMLFVVVPVLYFKWRCWRPLP